MKLFSFCATIIFMVLLGSLEALPSLTQPHQCITCLKAFKRRNHLVTHINVKHSPHPKKYACKSCNKVFLRTDMRTRHEATHLPYEDRPHECNHCKKKFIRLDNLKVHRSNKICTRRSATKKKKVVSQKKTVQSILPQASSEFPTMQKLDFTNFPTPHNNNLEQLALDFDEDFLKNPLPDLGPLELPELSEAH